MGRFESPQVVIPTDDERGLLLRYLHRQRELVVATADGLTIVLAGTRGSVETPGFDPELIVYKELRVLGALGLDGVVVPEMTS